MERIELQNTNREIDWLIHYGLTSNGRYFMHFRGRTIDQMNKPYIVQVQHTEVDLYCVSLKVSMSLHFDTLFWVLANPLYFVLGREAVATNFKVFGVTLLRIEPTTSCTWGQHTTLRPPRQYLAGREEINDKRKKTYMVKRLLDLTINLKRYSSDFMALIRIFWLTSAALSTYSLSKVVNFLKDKYYMSWPNAFLAIQVLYLYYTRTTIVFMMNIRILTFLILFKISIFSKYSIKKVNQATKNYIKCIGILMQLRFIKTFTILFHLKWNNQ